MDERSNMDVEAVNEEKVAVNEAPKTLTLYFHFYISECKGLKGREKKMINNARKALDLKWAQMTNEEKKPYFDMYEEQKHAHTEWISKGKVKEEVKKMSLRCSMKKLPTLFKEM